MIQSAYLASTLRNCKGFAGPQRGDGYCDMPATSATVILKSHLVRRTLAAAVIISHAVSKDKANEWCPEVDIPVLKSDSRPPMLLVHRWIRESWLVQSYNCNEVETFWKLSLQV